MLNNKSSEEAKALINQAQYNGRFLTDREKQELFESWHISVKTNQERVEQAKDPAVEGFVVGLQYSSICDARTCGYCSAHDAEALKIDDPRIKDNTPPIHLGCRCYWVPVTKFDVEEENFVFKWTDIKKPKNDFISYL